MRIGVVSDTHDRLPAALFAALDGVKEILHAGDVVSADALTELEAVAPVTAVHGNMDPADLVAALPPHRLLERGGVRIALIHGHRQRRGEIDDFAERFARTAPAIVIFGHSHEALSETRGGVHYFNPGTAGGVGAAPTIGLLTIEDGSFTLAHVALAPHK